MKAGSMQEKREITVTTLGREYGSTNCCAIAELERQILNDLDGCSVGILVDLGETVHIGCRLLTVLLDAYGQAKRRQRKFALCAVRAVPAEVLAVTSLDSLWPVFRTTLAAIDVMQSTLRSDRTMRRASVSTAELDNGVSALPATAVRATVARANGTGQAAPQDPCAVEAWEAEGGAYSAPSAH